MKITKQDVIKELERELKRRGVDYPKQIQAGTLNRERANKQYLALKRALDILSDESSHYPNPKPAKLFDV